MTMSPEGAPRQRGLVLLNKAEKLIIDLAPTIDKVPKHQRYRYAARLEDALWDLVARIIEAVASGQKSKIYRIEEQLRFIHSLLRHGAERKLVRPARVGEAAQQLREIGAMIGAWRSRL